MRKHLILIGATAFVGLLISAYLFLSTLSGTGISYCLTGSECDIVNNSTYAEILGIPVSLVGTIGYLSILIVSFLPTTSRKKWNYLFVLSTIGVSFSLYLTYLEIFEINTICAFCIASLVIILIIFTTLLFKKTSMAPKTSSLNMATLAIVLSAGVMIGASVINSSEQHSTRSNRFQIKLAKHLNDTGAVMYGAYNCSHCTNQKLAFGKQAFKHINYVECHPRGKNPNPSLCSAKNITSYPTWEIGRRFYKGQLNLQTLSQLSNFRNGDK